jgi:polysaccharide pyruvyl transferase WcaK-like protein
VNLLAPWGFYGSGNIGDEATLQGFAQLVAQAQQPIRVWAGSRNPRHTARVAPSFRYFRAPFSEWDGCLDLRPRGLWFRYFQAPFSDWSWRRRWANYRTSAVVVAGGTPIMDCHGEWPFSELVPLIEDAHRRERPVVFVGSGTERLQREESRRIMADRLAPIVRYWTVRSEPDEARLIEYGVSPERIRVAGDMAWLLDPASPDWGREQLRSWGVATTGRLVGVNLMNEKQVRERQPHLLKTVARFLDRLVEHYDVSILFLASEVHEFTGFDRSATLQTLAAMKHRHRTFLAPNEYWPPQKMMSLIANCYVSVSMRYHFCLFSALQGVPFIALQRSDKVADLCWDLAWLFGANLDGLSGESLIALFQGLENQRAAAVNQLGVGIPILRERACSNVAALEALQDR